MKGRTRRSTERDPYSTQDARDGHNSVPTTAQLDDNEQNRSYLEHTTDHPTSEILATNAGPRSHARVHWLPLSCEIPTPAPTPATQLPSAYDEVVHRRRKRRARKYSSYLPAAVRTTSSRRSTNGDEEPRGRSRTRRTTIPTRQKSPSPPETRKRLEFTDDLPDETNSLVPSSRVRRNSSQPDPAPATREQVFEPKPIERVSSALSEVLSSTSSGASSETDSEFESGSESPTSPVGYFPEVPQQRGILVKRTSHGSSPGDADGVLINTTPFEKTSTYRRISVSTDRFKNHRDTFALLKLPRAKKDRGDDRGDGGEGEKWSTDSEASG
ncbi:MAG: hypothetical protein MMC23_002332 [Stictis urceolatum]|nr:hypothetical protein [Stictis urceolata]